MILGRCSVRPFPLDENGVGLAESARGSDGQVLERALEIRLSRVSVIVTGSSNDFAENKVVLIVFGGKR